MNIISNNCIGGYIYRDILKEEYQNPFIWTSLDNTSVINLLEHYNTINFENIEIFKQSSTLSNFYLNVDDQLNIQFSHYVFDAKYDKPTIIGIDVHYNKIWEYIVDVYLRRLKRMSNAIDFIFIEDNGTYDIKKITTITQQHHQNLFVVTNQTPKIKSDTLVIVPHITYQGWMAHFYKEYYKDDIKKFMHILS